MSNADPDRVKKIFDVIADAPTLDRPALLDRECGDDAALRSEVESLLAADEQAANFLPPPRVPAEDAVAGMRIGPYTLLELVGEGGFGHVWRAVQSQPIARQVALKLLKPEVSSRQVLARFDGEREALAMMDHPGIARVFDAGITSTGRPYFVMELVRGVPLVKYCDEEKLDLKSRLELFVQICQAVQHAHAKGVIHRDLKPGNVLVTEIDGKPAPKIIDFGVAKATAIEAGRRKYFTEFRQLVGTPEYMSPEQASMASQDVDTRSDIYSLGVILYELLVGVTPLDAHSLREAAYAEMQRMIQEVDPPRPSTRLSLLAETIASIAAVRKLDPGTLAKRLKGELDWIVMKCLEKQRSRRYATAASLADDLQAYLTGGAVSAAPPTVGYRVRKFIRRHRTGTTIFAAVATAVLLGLAGVTWQFFEARRARDSAVRALAEAAAQRDEALQQRANAVATDEFLVNMLSSADPGLSGGDQVTVKQVADRALADLDRGHLTQPLVEASIRNTLSTTYLGLGHYETALNQAQQAYTLRKSALGDDHPDTISSQNNLAVALSQLSRIDETIPILSDLLERQRRLQGETAATTLLVKHNLGQALLKQGKLALAEPLLRDAFAGRRALFGEDHRLTLISESALAGLGLWTANLDESELLFRDVLSRRKRLLGENDSTTATAIQNLGVVLLKKNVPEQAEPLFRQALSIRTRVLGADHAETIDTVRNLGDALRKLKRYHEADPLLQQAAESCERVLGPDHPDTIRAISVRLWFLIDTQRGAEAIPLARDALSRGLRGIGADHPDTITLRAVLATALKVSGDFAAAETEARQVVVDRRRVLGEDHAHTVLAWSNLGDILASLGKPDPSADAFLEAYNHARNSATLPVPLARHALRAGRQLVILKRWDKADVILGEGLSLSKQAGTEAISTQIAILKELTEVAKARGDTTLADQRQAELGRLRASTQPTTNPAVGPPVNN